MARREALVFLGDGRHIIALLQRDGRRAASLSPRDKACNVVLDAEVAGGDVQGQHGETSGQDVTMVSTGWHIVARGSSTLAQSMAWRARELEHGQARGTGVPRQW
ncbi:hypothetical protein HAX54_015907 [Datura stramonium]|uniref:Uncharacterized protein n=1 Tax=Datura stramonium TaxID=4076 RepID=A0ABS8UI58_DATST|nr:hypothetical protein [Datura stramonium]